ncbi:hypothetical protein [Micrococcus luteus]|uniref:hypothetical protein n=1 Tax=Micrococcus luteus TaxID=1270 RepID=UPI0022391DEC|nr:hypothetical protein [Micrococcus luteus]
MPEVLIQEVLALLAEYGYGQVDEVVTAEEDIIFSLPKELRAELKRVGDESARSADAAATPRPDRAPRLLAEARRLAVTTPA